MEPSTMWYSLTLIVVACYLLYRYLTRNYDYWSKQNVPFKVPRLILGSVNFEKPLHIHEKEMYEKYGRIYGGFDGTMPVLTVGDPELLKDILVKDFHIFPNHRHMKSNDPIMDNSLFVLEGRDWKRVRNTVSPIFTSAKLRKMIPLFEECADIVVGNFEKLRVQNEKIICQTQFRKFAMGTIARCAFGIRISEEDEDKIVEKAKETFSCAFSWRTMCIMLFPQLMKWFRISLLNPETLDYYRRLLTTVVEQTKHTDKKDRADFLQRVLAAEDRYNDKNNNGAEQNGHTMTEQNGPTTAVLSPEEVMAQCIVFFMTGFDATTSMMSYTIYQLAAHPEYQEKLFREIQKVIDDNQNCLNYDAISHMKFLDAVMSESLRLCPTLVRTERKAEEDYVLGDTGIVIKKNMLISIPMYAMQRDPEWYPDPEKFMPERFLSEELAPPAYAYLPFGLGPRVCIGKRFVEVSAKLCLAKLIYKYNITLPDPNNVNLDIIETRGVLKADDVEVQINLRESN